MEDNQQSQTSIPAVPSGSGQQSIFYRPKPSILSWLSATVFTLAGLVELYVMGQTTVAVEADPACLAKAAANTSNPFAATGAASLCPTHAIGGLGIYTGPAIAVILLAGGGLWLSRLFYRTMLRRGL